MGRYQRQELVPWIGADGQRRIAGSTVGIVGMGALGSTSSALLARAGVGRLILADRGVVEESNLHRQMLYTERDVSERLPKSEAAARHLRDANSSITIEPLITDVMAEEAEELFSRCDLVLDGTDNFETRFLLNDAAVKSQKPWIYAGAVADYGALMVVVPGEGPCLRCLFPEAPAAGSVPTCETAGVLGAAPVLVAAFQVSEAIKLLAGHREKLARGFVRISLAEPSMTAAELRINPQCRCCQEGRFDFLEEKVTSSANRLCGQNGVMIIAPKGTKIDLAALESRLALLGKTYKNDYLVQAELDGFKLTIYEDGRTMVQNTDDAAKARSIYARYIGI